MDTYKYEELKRKYEALLQENEYLKAKIREIESKSGFVHLGHESGHTRQTCSQNLEECASSQQSGAKASDDNFDNEHALTKYSQDHEKISLFMSLFKGRTDVYAKKWQGRKGS